MEKNNLNLQRMQEFLTTDVHVDYLVNELDKMYYTFTDMAMRLSSLENEPICEETLDCRYWIEQLKELFEEINKSHEYNAI